MKTITAILFIMLVHIAVRAEGQTYTMHGKVSQVTKSGLLIILADTKFGDETVPGSWLGKTVFLAGTFDGVVDEDRVGFEAKEDGVIEYVTVLGSKSTVRKLIFLKSLDANQKPASKIKQVELFGRVIETVTEGILIKLQDPNAPSPSTGPIKRIGKRSLSSGQTQQSAEYIESPLLTGSTVLLVGCPNASLPGSDIAFVATYDTEGHESIGGKRVVHFVRLGQRHLK